MALDDFGYFILGLVILFIAFILSAISFFSPFWFYELNTLFSVGLWGRCDPNQICVWFFERDFAWEKGYVTGWHKASQILFAAGIVILLASFLIALAYICCRCFKTFQYEVPVTVGTLIVIGMILETISIAVFGGQSYVTYEVSINSWVARFEWAYYVGIAGCIVCLPAAVIFIWLGRRVKKEHEGYEATPHYA